MTEQQWDKKLNIHTIGRLDAHADQYHYPYEPTPYSVLERLAERGYIRKESILVDYGCGKGRVSFFLHDVLGCRAIGLGYDEEIFRQAEQNKTTAVKKQGVTFFCENAEEFSVEQGDCFYFFNPFSVEILKGVMGRILESYYASPRRMLLFFYYPNDEYLVYLMTMYVLTFVEEIDCRDLFDGKDERERILIFELT
ncbi:MAG: SAM-dependent methyltransferase [Anaerotignum sp.]